MLTAAHIYHGITHHIFYTKPAGMARDFPKNPAVYLLFGYNYVILY